MKKLRELFTGVTDVLAFLVIVLFAVSVLSVIYSIFGGIWGFNPTSIENFNLKLFASSFISAIIWVNIMEFI